MSKKSRRGPRPESNRAERVAARKARQAAALAAPERPFADLPAAECDLVAMRAFIASASAQVTFVKGFSAANEVDFATILPGAGPGMIRERDAAIWGERGATKGDKNGKVRQGLVALQTDPEPMDLAAELAGVVDWAANGKPNTDYDSDYGQARPLGEIVDATAPLDVVVYENFDWWFAEDANLDPQLRAMLARANDSILPTTRLKPPSGVGAPWWVDAGDRAHLRWVRPEDEDTLMNALARVHAQGRLTMGEDSRFAGSFRTHGLVVPVFDLDIERHAQEWYDGLDKLDQALAEALADPRELTAAERGSRAGIIARQVTLR